MPLLDPPNLSYVAPVVKRPAKIFPRPLFFRCYDAPMGHIIFYSPDYVLASDGSIQTTRKSAWVARTLEDEGRVLSRPRPATEAQLLWAHSEEYIWAVRHGRERASDSSGLSWCPGVYPMAAAHSGGCIAAALTAWRHGGVAGTLSSGLHHAKRDRGEGFCTFNGLALAAFAAYDEGCRDVLILDLDAHCGGGTASIIDGLSWIRHVDVATDEFDRHDGAVIATDRREYHETVSGLLPRDGAGLCIYNAGMDVVKGDCGPLTHEDICKREAMVFSWAERTGTPIAYALAGGYTDRGTLVPLHRTTILSASLHRCHRRAARSSVRQPRPPSTSSRRKS